MTATSQLIGVSLDLSSMKNFLRWYDPADEDCIHRGVISSKVENGSDKQLPEGKFRFQAYEENAVPAIVDVKDIYTDLHFTQLQYEVGDRVLCLRLEWTKRIVTTESWSNTR